MTVRPSAELRVHVHLQKEVRTYKTVELSDRLTRSFDIFRQ
jgi:hypothetical protein